MSRSRFGIGGVVGAVVATVLMAGCGATENAQIVGVPPVATTAPAGSLDSAIAAFRQGLAQQLNQAAASGTSGTYVATQVNALTSDTSLIAAERMDALKALGATTAAGLQKTVSSLIATTSADPRLAAVSVDGHTVASTLLAVLRSSQAQIQALAAKIASDSLVDVLRADTLSLGSSNVNALLSPQAHLLIAAGDTLYQSNGFAQTSGQLATQVNAGASTDPNYYAERGLLTRLQASVATLQSTAVSVIRQVRGLTPAGFPANQGTLLSQQQALAALNVSNGPLATATSSIDQIKNLLGQRKQ